MYDKILKVIDEEIRPILQGHGGNIELLSVEDDTVKVKLLGACSQCPAANVTLIEVVENSIKTHFPEIKNVYSINETSQELLDFAKTLLSRNKS